MAEISFEQYYTPHPNQIPFHVSPARYRLVGGAMRGGKSRSCCGEGIQLSIDIPNNRGAILRKNLTTLRRTTLQTFFQILPPDLKRDYNKSEQKVTLINDSEILFLEADESKDPMFEKLKSLELGWFFIDECSEVARGAFAMLCTRLSWKPAEGHYRGLLASNPEQCWVKEEFIDEQKQNRAFFQMLAKDNPDLPDDYIPSLRDVLDENQQRKYIDGDWNVTDDPMQIIPYTVIKNAIGTPEELKAAEGKLTMGIDVGELGEDQTVFCYMRGAAIYELETFKRLDVAEVSNIAIARITERKINADDVGVDAIGVGAGVWANLKAAGYRVQRIIAGESPIEAASKKMNQNFVNLKSQMWWAFRLACMEPENGIMLPNRQSLIQDLSAIRYTLKSERKIEVESKEKLKKRIGRSPDEGDAAVIANWVRLGYSGKQFHFSVVERS